MGAIYFDFVDVGFADGSDKFHHWSVITGVFHVAVVTPFFALLKRSKPDSLSGFMYLATCRLFCW